MIVNTTAPTTHIFTPEEKIDMMLLYPQEVGSDVASDEEISLGLAHSPVKLLKRPSTMIGVGGGDSQSKKLKSDAVEFLSQLQKIQEKLLASSPSSVTSTDHPFKKRPGNMEIVDEFVKQKHKKVKVDAVNELQFDEKVSFGILAHFL